jgi:phosphinothricin acetyltransferase
MVRSASIHDAEQLVDIYNYYIDNTVISFEEEPLGVLEMKNRVHQILKKGYPYLVYEVENEICGYAYANAWHSRAAYKNSVETSVYLKHDRLSKGIGTQLYSELLKILKEDNYHAIIGGIALPNPTSVALHEKFGYKKVAHYKEVGYKFNTWVDVGYWQLLHTNSRK